MVRRQQRMSRSVRTARGVVGALLATALAAASHAIAGGAVTLMALIATIVVALPVCVALSGKLASIWRLTLAVASSQFLYHWTFAGLGSTFGTTANGEPRSFHASHGIDGFFPSLLTSASGGELSMWIAHAVTAILTIALIHRGETALLRCAEVLRRALSEVAKPLRLTPVAPPTQPRERAWPLPRIWVIALAAMSHRGPPRPLFVR